MRSATHEDFSRRDKPRPPSERSFGIVFAVFFLIVTVWPLVSHRPARLWAAGVAVLFLVAAFVRPSLLRPLNRIWTALGLLIGRVVEPVVTAVLFYAVFTPFGILMRVAGKDPLRLRTGEQVSSYWIERQPPGPPPESMANQF